MFEFVWEVEEGLLLTLSYSFKNKETNINTHSAVLKKKLDSRKKVALLKINECIITYRDSEDC